MRRSSFIASGAAAALEKLQREGLTNWTTQPIINLCLIQVRHVPGDGAIVSALRRVIEHPPEEAPIISREGSSETPPGLVRKLWMDKLAEEVKDDLPVEDLLAWLAERYPSKNTSEILGGFSRLIFRDDFRATFTENSESEYSTSDGSLRGNPLRLESV